MKRILKSALGVTLLEVMLVLAVAAMVIVMSVRYYQSATANQQANAVLEEIQAITAAADGLAQGSGKYSSITSAAIQPMMPNGQFTTPWGGSITITVPTATGYTVNINNMPVSVCGQLVSRLKGNTKYSSLSGCGSTATGTIATFSYTYNSQG